MSQESDSGINEAQDYAAGEEEVEQSGSLQGGEDEGPYLEGDIDDVLLRVNTSQAARRRTGKEASTAEEVAAVEEVVSPRSKRSRRPSRADGPARMKGEPNYKTDEAQLEAKRLQKMHEDSLAEWSGLIASDDFDAAVRAKYNISGNYRFRHLPNDGFEEYVCGRSEGDVIYLHFENFLAGWRPPFDPFLVQMLDLMEAAPCDFHPNASRAMTAFIVACRLNKIEPYLGLFRDFFDLTGVKEPKGLITLRSKTGVTRLFLPPFNKIRVWPNRVMRVESKVGWPFRHYPSRKVRELGSSWSDAIDVGSGRTDDIEMFQVMLGSAENKLQTHALSTRGLTDLNLPRVTRAGVPGSSMTTPPAPLIEVPAPGVGDAHICWRGDCHLGKVFPLDCEQCGGFRDDMVVIGPGKKDLKKGTAATASQLEKLQKGSMPLIDVAHPEAAAASGSKSVAGSGSKSVAAGGSKSVAAAGSSKTAGPPKKIHLVPTTQTKSLRMKSTVSNPAKRKTAIDDVAVEDEEAGDEVSLAQRKSKKTKIASASGLLLATAAEGSTVAEDIGSMEVVRDIVNIDDDDDDVDADNPVLDQAATGGRIDAGAILSSPLVGAHVEAGAPRSPEPHWNLGLLPASTPTFVPRGYPGLPHLNPTFMRCPSTPDWAANVRGSLSNAPPVPNMMRDWPPEARRAIGEGLVMRVAPTVDFPSRVDGIKAMEIAIGELGFMAHTTSACMLAALEAMKQNELRESCMSDQIKASHEEAARRDAKFNEVLDQLEAKLADVRKYVDTKDESLRSLEFNFERLKTETAAKLKETEAELADERRRSSEAEAARAKLDEEAKAARSSRRKAERELAQVKKELAEVKTGLSTQVAEGIQAYRDSQPFQDEVQACYTKGINHMARCVLASTAKGEAIDLPKLAEFAATYSYSSELSRLHNLVPYPEDEIKEFNEYAAENGLAPLENLPAVEAVNLSTLRAELEKSDEEEAAVEAEVTDEQTEVETPVGDPEKEIDVMITVDPDTDQVVIGEESAADADAIAGKDQVAGQDAV